MKKSKYYSLKNILSKNCTYSIIGGRSNGKTYACLKYGIEQYVRSGVQLAVVRRWQDDFKSKRGASMFDALIANGEIDRLTNHQWTDVYYYGSRWFFCKYDENKKRIVADDPFAFAFAISSGTTAAYNEKSGVHLSAAEYSLKIGYLYAQYIKGVRYEKE